MSLFGSCSLGSRGPKPADSCDLKIATTQWLYVLFGLRDGFAEAIEQPFKWHSGVGEEATEMRQGRSEKIHLARIARGQFGEEIALRTFQRVTLTTKESEHGDQVVAQVLYERVDRNVSIPARSIFGLIQPLVPALFFPPVSPRPDLWNSLKKAPSIVRTQHTLKAVSEWFGSSFSGMPYEDAFLRALSNGSTELFRVRKLWNYPASDRPSSDEKRLEFFAKALGGLVMGISPATATKKLSNWNIPKLWSAQMGEGDLPK